jgi:hypothetical protein
MRGRLAALVHTTRRAQHKRTLSVPSAAYDVERFEKYTICVGSSSMACGRVEAGYVTRL